jgi:hypothetical protein
MEKTVAIKEEVFIPLQEKKVKVVPVPRASNLPAGHDGEFMFTGTKYSVCLPFDLKKNRLASILTREEQRFFEKELDLEEGDLSIHKKKDNFWHTFYVVLDKDDYELDLQDPIDNLRYRVLAVQPTVAPSWEQRYHSGAYKFALVDEEIKTKIAVAQTNTRKDAYKFLGKVEDNAERMRDVLRIYGEDPGARGKQKKETYTSKLVNRLGELIDDDASLVKLMKVVNDPHFEMKIFIEDALAISALTKEGTKYYLPGDDKIGGTLQEAIDYFKNPVNQDVYLKIKNQIELSN